MRFLSRNFWAIVCSLSFIAGLTLAFSASGFLFWFGVVASLGTGVSAFYLWMDPIWSKPWERTYHTPDWWTAERQPPEAPQILIPGAVHKKGRKPKVEFERASQIYGIGELEHTYVGDDQEDVLLTRPNSSMPPFGPVIVRIRK